MFFLCFCLHKKNTGSELQEVKNILEMNFTKKKYYCEMLEYNSL
jgi:hypothetical protein